MSEKILVTGASGFIGRNIVTGLLDAGYEVKAQHRRAKPPPELIRDGVETVRADLTDPETAKKLVSGTARVIHAAAHVAMTGKRTRFHQTNVDATGSMLDASVGEGCWQFVHISSLSVQGFGEHLDSDETGPYYPLVTEYQKTKKMAEERVHAETRVPWTIIRPGLVYGPGDTTTLKPAFDLLLAEKLPLLSGFEVYNCPIFVTDLVSAVVSCLGNEGATGQIFDIVSGEKVLLKDALAYAAELLGVRPPKTNIPAWVAAAGAAVLESLYALLRIQGEPLVTRYLTAELSRNFHFSGQKSRSILGKYAATGWREGLQRAVKAYLEDKKAGGPG